MDEKNKPFHGQTREEFYRRLREELDRTHDWPVKYMFKFILPNDEEKVRQAKAHFADLETQFRQNYSRNGKFVALTFVAQMENPQQIIERYQKMEDIEGLLAI